MASKYHEPPSIMFYYFGVLKQIVVKRDVLACPRRLLVIQRLDGKAAWPGTVAAPFKEASPPLGVAPGNSALGEVSLNPTP